VFAATQSSPPAGGKFHINQNSFSERKTAKHNNLFILGAFLPAKSGQKPGFSGLR
jgi:hypothetical protein